MKQVIQGLEEGLNAIAEAVGGGGGSSIVPTPTAADEGKVLTANDDGTASWEDASGVDMTGAQAGQVLTAIQDMGGNLIQGWTTPDEGLPEITSSIEQGAVLAVGYSKEAEWENNITNLLPNGSRALVPTTSGAGNGYVLTNTNGTPTWAAASGGGGGSDVSLFKATIGSSDWFSDGASGYYAEINNLFDVFANYGVTCPISITLIDYYMTGKVIYPTSYEVDGKSGIAYIHISSEDYTALSGQPTYLKVLYNTAS